MARLIAILDTGETFELPYYFDLDLPVRERDADIAAEMFLELFQGQIRSMTLLQEFGDVERECALSRRDLESLLKVNDWNQKKTAEAIGCSPWSLNYMIHDIYKIVPPPGKKWSRHKRQSQSEADDE